VHELDCITSTVEYVDNKHLGIVNNSLYADITRNTKTLSWTGSVRRNRSA